MHSTKASIGLNKIKDNSVDELDKKDSEIDSDLLNQLNKSSAIAHPFRKTHMAQLSLDTSINRPYDPIFFTPSINTSHTANYFSNFASPSINNIQSFGLNDHNNLLSSVSAHNNVLPGITSDVDYNYNYEELMFDGPVNNIINDKIIIIVSFK